MGFRASSLVLALGLGGCLGAGEFADRAVEHNRAIAQASEEITLLNIVRAKYDRPIVYSQFGGVSEAFTNSVGIGTSIPFGPDAGKAYNADIAASPEQFVSLSTAPLDDQDFYQGVMRPVQVGLMRYYVDNGWPRDLVVALAVEKLEIGAGFYARVVAESDAACAARPAGLACQRIADPNRIHAVPEASGGQIVFHNDPRRAELFDPFHELVLRLIVLGLTIDTVNVPHEVRLPASAQIAVDADQIAKMTAASTSVRREGGDVVVTTYGWQPALRLAALGQTRVRVEGQGGGPAEVDMTASLRSPDSILFYLGAYARDGGADASILIDTPGHERWVSVFEIAGCDDAVVSVDFDGACYGIPRGGDHVSMKVIGFLQQVIALNKRAVEPPTTGVVKTVN
ncbi:MAG: hypothetical protein IT548_08335 [Alphaproteobacteria bacterium]|nr:hypothetical protein [Alphaproteobacteria bacterium]